jgi:riboflavin kinase/FMN adenylyltransferase
MSLSAVYSSLATTDLPPRAVHLAIGMFDGVHLGHQAVIESALHSARRDGGQAGVLTFFPHPSRLFRPEEPVQMIMAPEVKAWFLRQVLGVDFVVAEPFTREFAAITANEFLPALRAALPHLRAIYVGQNWRFGARRTGDVATLVAAAPALGVSVFSAPAINLDGEPISSTRIRGHLVAGEIAAANALLGFAYFARGTVVPGRRLGRKLGFPTLNLAWRPECRPAYGVYAVHVRGIDEPVGADRPAVANFGVRPSIDGAAAEPLLEVHVLGDCPWREGAALQVAWRHFLRREQKFAALEDLRAQIARDRTAAAEWLARAGSGAGD